MTERMGILRRRRRVEPAGIDGIPVEVQDWFAAGCPATEIPWPVLLPPTGRQVPEWFQLWSQRHPGPAPDEATRFAWGAVP